MATIGFLLTRSYNELFDLPYELGKAALAKGHRVQYFLYLDSTSLPIKYQSYALWEEQPKDKLRKLAAMGAEIVACAVCINARGLLEGKDYITEVRVGTVPDFAKMVGEVDRLLVF